jgi:hypothetical protein
MGQLQAWSVNGTQASVMPSILSRVQHVESFPRPQPNAAVVKTHDVSIEAASGG